MKSPKNFWSSLRAPARTGLLLGAGFIVLLTGALLWWVFSPREQLLFGNLREADAAEIVQSLNEWKVPHTIVDGGTGITVPDDLVYQTRMRLVSANVPRGGHVGFELFDDSDFGVTEFAQRVNYQRALQGEIERTIAALPGVETARVHLTIQRPGLFVGNDESSKASVALTLLPGGALDRQQINGIRSLVAAAVEGLAVDAVSVLGSDGTLLAAPGQIRGGLGSFGRTEEEVQLENQIELQVVELLGRFFSKEEFQVSVDARLNFDTVHEVNERPVAPLSGAVMLSKRVGPAGSGEDDTAGSREEIKYAHGTVRQEISRAPGRIERLSVAVVLPQSLDELKVERIQSLVAAAAGIDPDRGDRLEVLRFGRDGSLDASIPPSGQMSTPPMQAETRIVGEPAEVASNRRSRLPWLKWLLVGAVGLLVGVIIAIAIQRRPRSLEPREREAVLAKLRGWLAEGSLES